jgi:hypothetical protein
MVEVVPGYVMLGVLISISSEKPDLPIFPEVISNLDGFFSFFVTFPDFLRKYD